MSTRTVSEARAALSEIVDEVVAGGRVILTRHGEPVAVIVRPDAIVNPRAAEVMAQAAERRALEVARRKPLPPGSISPEFAEALIAEIRANRDDDVWTRLTQTS